MTLINILAGLVVKTSGQVDIGASISTSIRAMRSGQSA